MNILSVYISQHYRTGGQKRFVELLYSLTLRDHNVFLLRDGAAEIPTDRLNIYNLDVSEGLSRSMSFLKCIKKNIASIKKWAKPDIILIFGESSLESAAYLKKKFSVPVLFAVRNNWVDANVISRTINPLSFRDRFVNFIYGRRDILKEKKVKKIADKLVFQSEWDKNAFLNRQKFAMRNISIIPNSTRISWFDSRYKGTNQSKNVKRILFVGSDDPRKGLSVLLSAFKQLRIENTELQLLLLGYFKEDFLKNMRTKGLLENVSVAGVQSNTLSFLQEADLFVIPSLYDSFPNTLLEALFVGTLSIGTNVSGIQVMIQDPDLLFDTASVDSLKKVMERCLDPAFFNEKISGCRNRADDFDFDWVEPWENILMEASGKN